MAAVLAQHEATEHAVAPGVLQLPRSPWVSGALAPVISSRTIHFHRSRHHAGYIDACNRLLDNSPLGGALTLVELLRTVLQDDARTELRFAVAEAWNHADYWQSLTPERQRPAGVLAAMLSQSYGSYRQFAHEFQSAGLALRGSGWLWLLAGSNGQLDIAASASNDTWHPLANGQHCLLTIDLWEHAYYLDHQDRRDEYLSQLIDRRLNWKRAGASYAALLSVGDSIKDGGVP